MTVRNPKHAARVLAFAGKARDLTAYLKSEETTQRHAAIEWLRAVARNDKRPEVRAYAAELELAVRSAGYQPSADSRAWLERQAKRAARFPQSRWARWVLTQMTNEGRG